MSSKTMVFLKQFSFGGFVGFISFLCVIAIALYGIYIVSWTDTWPNAGTQIKFEDRALMIFVILLLFMTSIIGLWLWARHFFFFIVEGEEFLAVEIAGKRDVGQKFPRWVETKILGKFSTASERYSMNMQLVTTNPSVVPLSYFVDVQAIGPGILNVPDGDVGCLVESELYEFNHECHGEIAGRFYNPLDEKQQGAFEQLLIDWLGPRIAQYDLKASNAEFSIN